MKRTFISSFQLIVAAVQALPVAGCMYSSTQGCTPTQRLDHEQNVSVGDFEAAIEDGQLTLAECKTLCGVEHWVRVDSCEVGFKLNEPRADDAVAGPGGAAIDDGDPATLAVSCEVSGLIAYCEGRRHFSWERPRRRAAASTAGAWLAESAANEAGSVRSFRALAAEVAEVCSPDMVRALRHAAREEAGHARLLGRLARRHGYSRVRSDFVATPARSVLEVAIENAQEGCVNETLAGLIAFHQASAAEDEEVRQALSRIAAEEARHAEIAWALHWELREALAPDEQVVLDCVLATAVRVLEHHQVDLGLESDPGGLEARRRLGLPSEAAAREMCRLLSAELRQRTGEVRGRVFEVSGAGARLI